MVCVNRRDYPGTTLYTPAELNAIRDGNEHGSFFVARGVELAAFLDGLIDALSLPGHTSDGKEGGLALMGWSMGNMFTLSTIASVSSLQPQTRTRLQLYLRKFIMFGEIAVELTDLGDIDPMVDPPSQALGISGASAPPVDRKRPQQEVLSEAAQWLSSYFIHGDLSTRDVRNIEFMTPDLSKQSVIGTLPPEELSTLTDYEAVARSDTLLFMSPTVLFNQMYKALFDPETRSLWPKLDFWLLYCDSSAGMMVHAAWEIEKLAQINKDQPVQILTIEDAHHIVSELSLTGTGDTYLRAGVLGRARESFGCI